MNIPTAEEWLSNNKEMSVYDVAEYDEGGYLGVNETALYKMMNEYAILKAKHYVEAALKAAEEIAIEFDSEGNYDNSILNSYPLTNIK